MYLRLKGALLAAAAALALPLAAQGEGVPAPRKAAAKKSTERAELAETDRAPRKLPGGWTLKWHDEFNGSKLDTTKWQCEQGTVRNKGASHVYVDDCVEVKNGMLILHSKAKDTPNPVAGKAGVPAWDSDRAVAPFASGSVTTRGRVTFSPPGRLEFRARIPKAKGVWPAIWTMHVNSYGWPANGEIDILEHISQEPNTVHSVFRWGQKGLQRGDREKTEDHITRIPDFSKEFHTYVLEWDKSMMRILIDDKEVGKIDIAQAEYPNGDNPLLTPCYIIMNTAIGGSGTWAEAPNPAHYPVQFEIDYVRFYAKSGGSADAHKSGSAGKSSPEHSKKQSRTKGAKKIKR